jgi:hypothetical protein
MYQWETEWLREARSVELQRLLAYIAVAATILFGELEFWSVLAQSSRNVAPAAPVSVILVAAGDILFVYFALAAVARYDLVALIDQRLQYPEKITTLLRDPNAGKATEVARKWLTLEYALLGASTDAMGGSGPFFRFLVWASPNRIWLPRVALIFFIIILNWLIFQTYWPWLRGGA